MGLLITYTSNIQSNKLMKFLFKYLHFTSSITGHLKDVSIFGLLKGSSIAVVFARLFGPLTVKRQWSTYSWFTTVWLF